MFADYRKNFNPDAASLSGIRPGDILVIHDSVKAAANTLLILRKLLKQHQKTTSHAAYNAINH